MNTSNEWMNLITLYSPFSNIAEKLSIARTGVPTFSDVIWEKQKFYHEPHFDLPS